MDKLKINKEEMHNPFKHVVIKKEPVMLDFERTNFTTKPKNVTQFCQYVNKLKPILEKKGFSIDIFKLRQLSKEYKNNISKKSFNKIINSI